MCPIKQDSKGEDLLRDLDRLQSVEALPDIEPPAMIDQAVRNMARRHLHNPGQKQGSPNAAKFRWLTGLATVSMAVIALGIALVQKPLAPDMAEPTFRAKKDEGYLTSEKANDTLQSTESLQLESADEPTREADRSATLGAMKQLAEPMAAAPAAAPAKARLSEEAFAGSAAETRQVDKEPAQAWLELIQQLHEQGLTAQANAQLREFVTDYPDFPLPDWALQLQQLE